MRISDWSSDVCSSDLDCPQGNYRELRAVGVEIESGKKGGWAVFTAAAANYRVWMLFVTYGCCFGIELFVHGVAASYYVDRFDLTLGQADRKSTRLNSSH